MKVQARVRRLLGVCLVLVLALGMPSVAAGQENGGPPSHPSAHQAPSPGEIRSASSLVAPAEDQGFSLGDAALGALAALAAVGIGVAAMRIRVRHHHPVPAHPALG